MALWNTKHGYFAQYKSIMVDLPTQVAPRTYIVFSLGSLSAVIINKKGKKIKNWDYAMSVSFKGTMRLSVCLFK